MQDFTCLRLPLGEADWISMLSYSPRVSDPAHNYGYARDARACSRNVLERLWLSESRKGTGKGAFQADAEKESKD